MYTYTHTHSSNRTDFFNIPTIFTKYLYSYLSIIDFVPSRNTCGGTHFKESMISMYFKRDFVICIWYIICSIRGCLYHTFRFGLCFSISIRSWKVSLFTVKILIKFLTCSSDTLYFLNNVSNRLILATSWRSIKGYFLKTVIIGIPKMSVKLLISDLMSSAGATMTEGSFFICIFKQQIYVIYFIEYP